MTFALKKFTLFIALWSVSINPALHAIVPKIPWYKNGWNVSAIGHGIAATYFICAGTCLLKKYLQLKREKQASPITFGLHPKKKEILKITKFAAPGCLATGSAFALATALFYRRGIH